MVSGSDRIGGLVGLESVRVIRDSYFDTETAGTSLTVVSQSQSKTTDELQEPTTYTGIYANWNVDLDNADFDFNELTGGDDPWDFGTSDQYPLLDRTRFGGQFIIWEIAAILISLSLVFLRTLQT